jgi:hypothetical protein
MHISSPRLRFFVAVTVAVFAIASVPQIADAKTRKPTLAEIAAAQAVENQRQAAAAAAAATLSSATKSLAQLQSPMAPPLVTSGHNKCWFKQLLSHNPRLTTQLKPKQQ